jgi:hypothetical protein
MDLQSLVRQAGRLIEHSQAGFVVMLIAVLALYFGFLGVLFYFSMQIAGLIKLAAVRIQSRNAPIPPPTDLSSEPIQ